MVAFRTPPDVGNRALQHCGQPRMDAVLGFSDPQSRGAAEISACYDQMREAELRKRFWTFAIRRTALRAIDGNTMRLTPALWSALTTYFVGSIVADQSGNLWISRIPNNLNNDPLLTTFWEPYFGPLSVALYDSTTAYFSGEVVYTTAGAGTALVYLSLQDANSDAPGTATPYDATVTYWKNQVVTFSSVAYMSLINLNLNNEPDLAPALFNIATTYATGNAVGGSDGVIYTSVGSGNVGHDPTLDGGVHWTNTGVLNPWTTVFVGGTGSDKWLLIGGTGFPAGVGVAKLNIINPVGGGPSSQSTTANVYLKPAGYLRLAPQNPKRGINSLGGPSGSSYNDWLIEGKYLISREAGPIILRFVGDFTDVARMNADFCEGLAARIALAIVETLTQSAAKIQIVAKIFEKWENDAKTIDGIESGYEDPPDDEFLTVRL